MSDERLMSAINDPDTYGAVVTLADGNVQQGNHRIGEALRRMNDPRNKNIDRDTEILVIP